MSKRSTPANTFTQTVRAALDHFHDLAWLVENSPLATAYFLGHKQLSLYRQSDRLACGRALQDLLKQTAAQLWMGALPKDRATLRKQVQAVQNERGYRVGEFAFLLLDMRYLHQYHRKTSSRAIVEALVLSKSRFHVYLNEAVEKLTALLQEQVNPTLRLEQPRLTSPLIGRQTHLTHCLTALQTGQCVTLSGMGGVGKTTLGHGIAEQWETEAVFWYTFRPNLNDNLNSLLFALGHFINQFTTSLLWSDLMSQTGQRADPARYSGLLRADMENLRVLKPLLCFDEVDILVTSGSVPLGQQHAQLLEFLEGIRDCVPLLLIGQRAYIDTPVHFVIDNFDSATTRQMLEDAALALSEKELKRVQKLTAGLPRLIALVIALVQTGEPIDALDNLHARHQTQPLFHRLWRRLDAAEKEILAALTVFRSSVPADIWTLHHDALRSLRKRQLIEGDIAEAIALTPFVRELVYTFLLPEQREKLHLQAAHLRAQRGEHTAAAYHYWRGNDWDSAVAVWFPQQELEIQRGQADTAQYIFDQITPTHLSGKHKKQLKLIQNRLYLFAGQARQVLENMATYSWEIDDQFSADAYRQWGQAQQTLGSFDEALTTYEQAIEQLSNQTNKIVDIHFQRGTLHIELGDISAAQSEVHAAQFTIAKQEAVLAFMTGHFVVAQTHYRRALELAKQLKSAAKQADIQRWLAMVAGRYGDIMAAERHTALAASYYEQIGNRFMVESIHAELAGFYLDARQFERVILPSEHALQFFEQIGHEPRICPLYCNLAEAYFELGELDIAKQYAFKAYNLEQKRHLPHALYTLGRIHQAQSAYQEAEHCFLEGIKLTFDSKDAYFEAYLQRLLGVLYCVQKRDAAGMIALKRAVMLFEQMNNQDEVERTRKQISNYYEPSKL